MATVYGANNTSTASLNDFGGKAYTGNLRTHSDTYECSSTASGTVINMGTLQEGVTIHGLKMWADDLGTGTTATVKIGSTTYFNAIDVATAASFTTLDAAAYIDSVGTTLSASGDLTVTIGVASATGTIKVLVLYTV